MVLDVERNDAGGHAGTGVPAARAPAYRVVRMRDPRVALARAVELCARHEAFAERSFGHWTRVLIGQVNRGQYRFVVPCGPAGPEAPIAGFAGWFRATEADAERWLAGASIGNDPAGRCIVLNALAAEAPGALSALLGEARALEAAPYTLYAKRAYPGGRTRPVRLSIPARDGAAPIAASAPAARHGISGRL